MAKHSDRRDTSRGTEPEIFSDPKISEVHTQLAREKEEPAEGFSGIPVIIVFVFCILGFWGSVYLTQKSGATPFDGNTFIMTKVAEDTGPKEPKSVEQQIIDGKKQFETLCASCHQSTGLGTPGTFPPLANSPWVRGAPERVIKIATCGIAGEIEVEGRKFNGAMPDIAKSLSDQKLADLVTYIRQAWGNKADAVDEETVKEIRKTIGSRGQWSAKEILELHPLEK